VQSLTNFTSKFFSHSTMLDSYLVTGGTILTVSPSIRPSVHHKLIPFGDV